MRITAPGIFYDMDTDDYFADPCIEPSLTQSLCKILIEQSPMHARLAHPRLTPAVSGDDEDSPTAYSKALAIGNAAHLLMAKRGKKLGIIDAPDFRSKNAQTDKAAAIQRGEEPILRRHYNTAVTMAEAARYQLSKIPGCERAYHLEGHGETVIASCEDNLWLRSMVDWITPDLREIFDLKTSGMSASPYNTGKLMASAGWHLQAAMHERILDAIDPAGAGRRHHFYICQENTPPYALTVNQIGEAALTIGRKQVDYAIRIWRHCIEHDTWPAYPLRIIRPELPPWSENGWINREAAEWEEEQAVVRKDFDPKVLMAG